MRWDLTAIVTLALAILTGLWSYSHLDSAVTELQNHENIANLKMDYLDKAREEMNNHLGHIDDTLRTISGNVATILEYMPDPNFQAPQRRGIFHHH